MVIKKTDLKRYAHIQIKDAHLFFSELAKYSIQKLHLSFIKIDILKGKFVVALYQQRGKHVRKFVHSGMVGIAAFGIIIAPVVAQEFPGRTTDPWTLPSPSAVLSTSTTDPQTYTVVSDKVRGEIVVYEVQDGDTISSIAEKFGVDIDTILWQNSLNKNSKIKKGNKIEILPVSGVAHKVKKSDTVYSIAKRYDVDPQQIVNYPFNSYTNDETFELAVGQVLIVPDGVMPKEVPVSPRARQITPDAGTVVASGQFVWPTSGRITSRFVWYHKGLDIANKAAPNILAADAGTVEVAGWPDNFGYGNRVVINHGNGYRTLYGHLSRVFVIVGQSVNRGDAIGVMGSTGRSTGTHLHFEVIRNGAHIDPLGVLQ